MARVYIFRRQDQDASRCSSNHGRGAAYRISMLAEGIKSRAK
jgi:hypothetical protein